MVDKLEYAKTSTNGTTNCNSGSDSHCFTGDISTCESYFKNVKDAKMTSNYVDRGEESGSKKNNQNDVYARCDAFQDGNENSFGKNVMNNASVIDTALDFLPQTTTDQGHPPKLTRVFPNPFRFGKSGSVFPMAGNINTIENSRAPTHDSSNQSNQSNLPPMNIGNLFNRQSAFRYSTPRLTASHALPTRNELMPPSQVTSQALLSLDFALHHNSAHISSKRTHKETRYEQKEGTDFPCSSEQKTLTKRQKNANAGNSSTLIDVEVRFGKPEKRVMPGRTVSFRGFKRNSSH